MSDRVVVVTGAASGIGRATAAEFGAGGDLVYVLDVDDRRGEETAAIVENSSYIRCDVTSPPEIEDALSMIEAASNRIDVLVNNAGGFDRQMSLGDTELEDWRSIVDLNLTSVFLMTKAALPLLRRSAAGRIVNIGSLAGQLANYRTAPPYAAAKAGVHALTRVLAWELAADGITVNALAPSAVMTERIEALRDRSELERTKASIPLGRYQTPEEVAAWVVFLASAEAGFMTGQTVSVNGGRFMT